MYNVLLVEDEILERESRRDCEIWQTGEFHLVADAANGVDAWEILQREPIDILVTDIKMPFMDGLELSRLVTRHMPQIRIIILSGHAEFKLAQQALSIGVSEYIVKPIRTAELLQALRKAADYLEDSRKQIQEIQEYRKQALVRAKLGLQVFFDDLSAGLVPTETILAKAAELGLDMNFNSVCCAILVYLDEKTAISDEDYLLILESHQIAEEFAAKAKVAFIGSHLRESRLFFADPEVPIVKRFLLQLFAEIKELYRQNGKPWQPAISLGGTSQGISGIAESLADARYLLNYRSLIEQTGPLFMDEALPSLKKSYAKEMALSDVKLAIDNVLRSGSKSEIDKVLDSLIKRLFPQNLNLMFFQFICIEIDNAITRFLLELDEDPARLFDIWENGEDAPLASTSARWCNDVAAFTEYLGTVLRTVIDLRDAKNKTRFVKLIAVAKQYIDGHFANEDISLGSVAAHININPSYFSSLFSQVMGESFIEYLTRVRIDKAKELIRTTSIRTTDIAFMVGYKDSNYFSKIFKKITQSTPRSFKNNA